VLMFLRVASLVITVPDLQALLGVTMGTPNRARHEAVMSTILPQEFSDITVLSGTDTRGLISAQYASSLEFWRT